MINHTSVGVHTVIALNHILDPNVVSHGSQTTDVI